MLSLTIGQIFPYMEPDFSLRMHTMQHVKFPSSSEDPFVLDKNLHN